MPTRAAATPVTGGMAIVDALIANDVDTVFGLHGARMYPCSTRCGSTRTGSGPMGRATSRPAATWPSATPARPVVWRLCRGAGAGVLNATAALCTAYGTYAPVLCLTGQVPSAFLGKGRGHLHELPDQFATLRSLTKWAARIDRVEDAGAIIDEAFRQMLSGRPGPVAVEMPGTSWPRPAPRPGCLRPRRPRHQRPRLRRSRRRRASWPRRGRQ